LTPILWNQSSTWEYYASGWKIRDASGVSWDLSLPSMKKDSISL